MGRRLFIAITLDDAVRAELARTQEALAAQLAHPKPSRPENLHLTLAFLGDMGEEREEAAREAMRQAARDFARQGGGPFELWLGDVGVFPKKRGAVVWQGVRRDGAGGADEGYAALMRLQAGLASCLRAAGLPLEGRPYVPHITLFRGARLPEPPASLTPPERDEGAAPIKVEALSLMWSHHPEGGLLAYDEIGRVEL